MKEFPLRDTGFRIDAVPLTTGVWGLKFIYPDFSFLFPAPEEWLIVLKKALLDLNEAKEIQLRIEKKKFEEFIPELPRLDFRLKHERIEFRSFVASLPDDSGTPISWRPMSDALDMKKAAEALHAVAQGDPDYDPSEDAMAALQYYFSDKRLTTSSECLQFGFVEGKLAALIVAQVRPEDGWSRITYMGVHPDFRGRGLGKWVHRKGGAMMKKLGGKNYFGGTVSTNLPMIRLFEKHGCQEIRVLQEWVLRKP